MESQSPVRDTEGLSLRPGAQCVCSGAELGARCGTAVGCGEGSQAASQVLGELLKVAGAEQERILLKTSNLYKITFS